MKIAANKTIGWKHKPSNTNTFLKKWISLIRRNIVNVNFIICVRIHLPFSTNPASNFTNTSLSGRYEYSTTTLHMGLNQHSPPFLLQDSHLFNKQLINSRLHLKHSRYVYIIQLVCSNLGEFRDIFWRDVYSWYYSQGFFLSPFWSPVAELFYINQRQVLCNPTGMPQEIYFSYISWVPSTKYSNLGLYSSHSNYFYIHPDSCYPKPTLQPWTQKINKP